MLGRQAERDAELAHFVLEQVAQRLEQLQAQRLGQAADVVVALDRDRPSWSWRRPTRSRPGRSCPAPATCAVRSSLRRLGLEHLDELAADDLALGLRVGSRRRAGRGTARSRRRGSPWRAAGRRTSPSPCRPSFRRSRPWSTNTQVSWSPIARWISAAATLESTPPDRPRITSSSPTCSRMRRHRLVDVVAHHPVGLGAARCRARSARASRGPARVCVTSGWNCTP